MLCRSTLQIRSPRGITGLRSDMADQRNGNWLDEFGACKVCDGEIPYGHTDNCDIWAMEQKLSEAEANIASLTEQLSQVNYKELQNKIATLTRISVLAIEALREFGHKHTADLLETELVTLNYATPPPTP